MYSTIRYHLTTPKKRTTISMDKIVSDLLAIKLGFKPISAKAHSAIRKQLETLLLPFHDPKSPSYYPNCTDYKPTQFVTKYAILWLVGEELAEKYYEHGANEEL